MPILNQSPMPLFVLAGLTGSGKTQLLTMLQQRGQQVISLEALAAHQGSVFGQLHTRTSLTAYQFHKMLHKIWKRLDWSQPVFCESKSPRLGSLSIPAWFFQQMRQAPTIWLAVSKAIRLQRVVNEYGNTDPLAFHKALCKLSKRLSNEQIQEIVDCYQKGKPREAFHILLDYYDKGKYYQPDQYHIIDVVHIQEWSAEEILAEVIDIAENYLQAYT